MNQKINGTPDSPIMSWGCCVGHQEQDHYGTLFCPFGPCSDGKIREISKKGHEGPPIGCCILAPKVKLLGMFRPINYSQVRRKRKLSGTDFPNLFLFNEPEVVGLGIWFQDTWFCLPNSDCGVFGGGVWGVYVVWAKLLERVFWKNKTQTILTYN